MNNTLRYIVALPAGFLAAFVFTFVSAYIHNYILEQFLYFDILIKIAEFILQGYATYLLVVVPFDIVPRRKLLFASLAFVLNIIAIIYNYITFNGYDHSMLISLIASSIALIVCYDKYKEIKEKEYQDILKYLDQFPED